MAGYLVQAHDRSIARHSHLVPSVT